MMNRRLQLESLENRQMLTGAVQVSGTADPGSVFAPELDDPVCTADEAPPAPTDTVLWYSMKMNGDVLNGCLYGYAYVDENGVVGQGSPSGTYRERGIDIYVGSGAEGDDGRFETTYLFTGKFHEVDNEFREVWGRCQHPITPGTGEGDYEGVTGRLDFKDEVADELVDFKFPYRGHLRFANDVPNPHAVDASIAASLADDDDSQDALFEDTEV